MALHVLVVEDSKTTADSLEIILRAKNYWVKTVASVPEALNWLTVGPLPDRVLVDYYLVAGDGIELVKSLRSMKGAENIPVVVMTAADTTKVCELRKITAKMGPISVIEKPFEADTLLEAIA